MGDQESHALGRAGGSSPGISSTSCDVTHRLQLLSIVHTGCVRRQQVAGPAVKRQELQIKTSLRS